MGNMSDYMENAVLNQFLRNSAAAAIATVYVALYSGAGPGEAGAATVNEVATPGTDGYARVAVTYNAPTAGTVSNAGSVVFGPATADWADVTYLALVDAATGGNVLFYKAFDSVQSVTSGQTLTIGAGNLPVTLA